MSPPRLDLASSTVASGDKAVNPSLPWELPWNSKDIRYGNERRDPVSSKGAGDKHNFHHSDIAQGALGDCYFLASLGAVAHSTPNLLASNISGPDSSGNYSVIFYRKNMWGAFEEVKIKVKSSFPQVGKSDYPAYAKEGDNKEMWVMLYEKAYAQLIGSYGTLNNGGHPEDALEALTGRESSATKFDQSNLLQSKKMSGDQIRDAVLPLLRDGKPVVASTHKEGYFKGLSKPKQELASSKRIVGGHAYSIISGDDKNVRLYNPWGDPEFLITWQQLSTYFYRFSNVN